MAGQEPLLPKPAASKRAKLSVLYGADEYLEELKKKYEVDHEIASLKAIQLRCRAYPPPRLGKRRSEADAWHGVEHLLVFRLYVIYKSRKPLATNERVWYPRAFLMPVRGCFGAVMASWRGRSPRGCSARGRILSRRC